MKGILTSLSWKVSAEENFAKYFIIHENLVRYFLSLFSFFEDLFCCAKVKQRNFLHVVDLSLDARFSKYPFSLHYHKQCPTNNIQIKCSQVCQNLCDIFWICFGKLTGLLILSFWYSDSDFWWPQQISQLNGNWLIYTERWSVQWSCDLYRHLIWRILKLFSSDSNFYLSIVFLLLSITFIPSLGICFSQ